MKRRSILIIVLVMILTFIATTVAYAANSADKNVSSKIEETTTAVPKVDKKKIVEKELTQEQIVKLYEKGYGLQDIEKAQQLAGISGKSMESILELKGKKLGKEQEDKEKSWDAVNKELGLDRESQLNKIGMKTSGLEALKEEGLTEDQAWKAGALAFNYKKPIKEIVDNLKKGKSLDLIQKQYRGEKVKEMLANVKSKVKNGQIKKAELKKITNDDVSKCKNAGITDNKQIVMLKILSDNYKITLDEVLKIYADRKTIPGVEKELEATK
jgi:cell division protein YceG involved in septum cleavage